MPALLSAMYEALEAVAASLGLTILDFQSLGGLGTTSIRIGTNNLPIAEAIRLLSSQQIIAAATATCSATRPTTYHAPSRLVRSAHHTTYPASAKASSRCVHWTCCR